MKILITGASSLVGFSILESLEGRRNGLTLIGIASDDDNSESLRYDHFEVVPQSADPRFPAHLEACVNRWQPDLILPGRDPDIAHLAVLRAHRPDLSPVMAVGTSTAATITLDKAITTRFAADHALPWADTLICGPDADASAFAARNPYPWIVKPSGGSGSHGVFLLTGGHHLDHWLHRPGFIVEPLLGPARQDIDMPPAHLGIPWFTDIEDPWLRTVQSVVLPDGTVGPSFCSDHSAKAGITQTSKLAEDADAVEIGRRWASALSEAGWRGSVNVQMKVDPELGPVPFETNGRMTGATHGRLLLGFDEVGIVVKAWTGFDLAAPVAHHPRVHYRPRAYPG